MINVVQHWFENTCLASQANTKQEENKAKWNKNRFEAHFTQPFRKNSQFLSTDRLKPQNEKIKCQNNDFWDLHRSVDKNNGTSNITSTYENLLTALQDLRTLGIFSSDLHKWKDLSGTFYKHK